MSRVARLAPSILAADYAHLAREVSAVETGVDWLHLDVMDAHFVPNLTIGPPVIRSLRPYTKLVFDCHLMMSDPGDYLEAFKEAGADLCSVHVEAAEPRALIDEMRGLGLGVGLALSPATPFEAAEPWLEEIDLLLVMSVVPGFGGQSFMPEVLEKVSAARRAIDEQGLAVLIEIDGGVDATTAPAAATAGVDVFVAGTAIFGDPDPLAAAHRLRATVERSGERRAG